MQTLSHRRSWLRAACALTSLLCLPRVHAGAAARDPALPAPDALADELAQALARQQPLVVMVSLPGCPFCRAVRASHLRPLQASGQAVVQIDLHDARLLRDFEGNAITQDALARRWGVRVAPTVLFFGAGGREVARRLEGAYLPDFYGAYLDDQLAQARQAVAAQR